MNKKIIWLSYFFIIILITTLVVLLINRIFYGVDTTDEAYCYAIPYRFLLGDIPFKDELAIHQTSSLFVVPFVKLYLLIAGNTDGLFLFMRFTVLLIATIVSISVYRVVSSSGLSRLAAVCISMLCVFYIGGLPSLDYNNIATLSLLCVLFLIFPVSDQQSGEPWKFFLSGLILSIGVISYPPLCLLLPIFLIQVLIRRKQWQWKSFAYFMGGLAVLCSAMLMLVLIIGYTSVIQIILFASTGRHLGELCKFRLVISGFISAIPSLLITIPYLSVSAVFFISLGKKYPALKFLSVPALFIPLLNNDFSAWYGSMRFVIFLGLLTPYFTLFTSEGDRLPKKIIYYIWVPSCCAGLITAWASVNGYMNFSVGFFPAAVSAVWILTHIIFTSSDNRTSILSELSILPPIGVVILFLLFNYSFVYGEGPIGIRNLNATIHTGIFRGLKTTYSKEKYLSALEGSVKKFKKEGSILFYDYLPAGYLMTTRRPASNTVWQNVGSSRIPLLKYLNGQKKKPSVIFRMKAVPNWCGGIIPLSYSKNDPLDQLVFKEYVTKEDGEFFTVLILPDAQ